MLQLVSPVGKANLQVAVTAAVTGVRTVEGGMGGDGGVREI